MMQRLGMLMLVVTVALATVAHDWCRLTCADSATHGARVTSVEAHAHCAQADTDAPGVRVAAATQQCRSDGDATPAATVSKITTMAPAPIAMMIARPLASRLAASARSASPASATSSSPLPLRL